MIRIKIPHDVVGTSRYHYEVLRSFPVERIEQGIGQRKRIAMRCQSWGEAMLYGVVCVWVQVESKTSDDSGIFCWSACALEEMELRAKVEERVAVAQREDRCPGAETRSGAPSESCWELDGSIAIGMEARAWLGVVWSSLEYESTGKVWMTRAGSAIGRSKWDRDNTGGLGPEEPRLEYSKQRGGAPKTEANVRAQDIWVKEEENMRKMVMIKKIDGLNNKKGKRKWQSMVLEMKIEEIVCSKTEVPARV
ncbi:hypothetical protein Tco_0977767 [Tanacetum coccineum]|uniref:Uncharacterized protein n=1 Tax=Tanacetum coccineum TaxID=301880 RepID=A0ABQ5EL17_9ASTR